LETLKICTGYKYKGQLLHEFPASLKVLSEVEPVYEQLPGWSESTTNVRSYQDLPLNARRYIERLSEVTGIAIGIVSVGPGREQTIIIEDMF